MKNKFSFNSSVIISSIFLIFTSLSMASEVLVNTQFGKVKGQQTGQHIAFKGIPFAAPPVGDNRWREPQPVVPWKGVLDANAYANDCMQLPFPSDAAPLGETPAEDCLYVNIWAPANTNKKVPVVFWVYGGGFVNGGSSPAVYDGGQFADKDVLFVSFNYRLGRFGFFAHPALTAAAEGKLANYAFMDQVAALKWVKDNIAAFNGDPDNITLMGESAGGRSVFHLLTADDAKGLFARAIIMSGGGRTLMQERKLNIGSEQQPSAEQVGVNFAKSKGIDGSDKKALAALRALSAEQVVDGLNLMAIFAPPAGAPTYVGGPIVDEQIVTDSTEALLKAGKAAHVPVMVGATSFDIGFNMFKDKDSLFATFGPLSAQAKAAYDPAGNLPVAEVGYAVAQDMTMQEPARFASKMMTKMGQPAYLYRFSYVAENLRSSVPGAQHATEIPFFFNTVGAKYGDKLTQNDTVMAETILQYMVNFAQHGNPNNKSLPVWQAYSPQQNNLMDFSLNDGPVHGTDPWEKRMNVIENKQDNKN